MRPAAIALNYSVTNIWNDIRQIIILVKMQGILGRAWASNRMPYAWMSNNNSSLQILQFRKYCNAWYEIFHQVSGTFNMAHYILHHFVRISSFWTSGACRCIQCVHVCIKFSHLDLDGTLLKQWELRLQTVVPCAVYCNTLISILSLQRFQLPTFRAGGAHPL